MEHAIYYKGSSMIACDSKGGYHIYDSKELAEAALAKLETPEGYEIKPYN